MSGQRRGFGVVNSNVMRSPSISVSAKALYSLLATYADGDGVCWPSNATLAEAMGTTDRTIRTLLAELQAKGVLERTEQTRQNGSQTTCVNVLLDLPTQRGAEAHFRPGEEADFRPKRNSTKEQDHSSARLPSSERVPEGFSEWWGLYPRKVGKQAAVKAYVKALKITDSTCLLTGLQQQASHLADRMKPDEFGNIYCPHPATWLNEGRWDDEVTPRKDKPKTPMYDTSYRDYLLSLQK